MKKAVRFLPSYVGAITGVVALLLASCAGSGGASVPGSSYTFPPGPTARELLLSDRFTELNQRFTAAQGAYSSGAAADTELRVAIREFYDPDPELAPKYDAWVVRFPNSYVAHLARGIYYARVGDRRRGAQLIADTPDQQVVAAEDAWDRAMTELNTSMRLDPKPLFSFAYAIDLAQNRGDLAESRRWLDKADSLDPINYVVRAHYMTAIETRWGGNQRMMQAFLEECRAAKLSEEHMKLLESVVVEDQGWVHQFIDHDYAAAEAAYRKSAALGGDKQLANLAAVLFEQHKYREAIEPFSEELQLRPGDTSVLANRSFAYFQIGMAREGLADLRAAAEGGEASAQSELGRYYMSGIPELLIPDQRQGMEWFQKSAAQGDPAGQQNLEQARKLLGDSFVQK